MTHLAVKLTSLAELTRDSCKTSATPFDRVNDTSTFTLILSCLYFRWYHGAISRREAEEILRCHKEGSYLVRTVDSSRQEYALSLKYGNCTF